MITRLVVRFANYFAAAVLILLFGFSNVATAAEVNPLRPIDASSPRATLQGFVETIDELYLHMADLLKSYAASDRLYLSPDERKHQIEILLRGLKAAQFLDTSEISPVLRDTIAVERTLQLKEILDRIELPAFDDIPDREAVARSSAKKWRLPGTAIDIVLIENGPRAGEYLVSAETVDRLPEFYERVEVALQARSCKAARQCLPNYKLKPGVDHLRGLFELTPWTGSARTAPLDAEPATLGKGRHRRNRCMAVGRTRFRFSR